jgi:hypothetical protein
MRRLRPKSQGVEKTSRLQKIVLLDFVGAPFLISESRITEERNDEERSSYQVM